jgi:hypothetical protein
MQIIKPIAKKTERATAKKKMITRVQCLVSSSAGGTSNAWYLQK